VRYVIAERPWSSRTMSSNPDMGIAFRIRGPDTNRTTWEAGLVYSASVLLASSLREDALSRTPAP
jgi:hypothetical protein